MTRAHEHMLIRLVLGGDEAAATELVRAHQGSLFAFLVRLSGRRDLAEDVMQEAFVRALQHLHRFDFEHRFSTWLFTIARRVYWNLSEKRTPSPAGDALEGLHEAYIAGGQGGVGGGGGIGAGWGKAAPQVAQGMELREERTRSGMVLQAALLELPPVQREIVVLFHQQSWPIALIASTLEMPEGTVKSHLHRARIRLRELIEVAEGGVARLRESPESQAPSTLSSPTLSPPHSSSSSRSVPSHPPHEDTSVSSKSSTKASSGPSSKTPGRNMP